MSECVVRMKMPKSCKNCHFRFHMYCGLAKKDIFPEYVLLENRPYWCPIICALPEWHGRLIDGSNLAEKHRKLAYKDKNKYDFHITAKAWVEESITIVPADAESPSPKPTDPLPIRGVEYVPTEVDVQTGTVTYELRERSETCLD